jgi:prepilin-type N-terminal cleavage/methylation domain-containing protein
MKTKKTVIPQYRQLSLGFTLVEMLIVISIIGFVASIPLIAFRVSNEHLSVLSGQATVIQALETARNKASSGVANVKHGVHIEHDRVILFQGDSYTGQGITSFLPPYISTDLSGTDIVFSRIAGTTTDQTIVISDQSGNATTVIVKNNGFIQ